MSIPIALLISYYFLSPPWSIIVVVGAVFLEGFEIFLWLRWRNVRSVTGEDALIGATGRVLSDCRPDGQVMVRGQIWTAHCRNGAGEGDEIRVVGIQDGIKIIVATV